MDHHAKRSDSHARDLNNVSSRSHSGFTIQPRNWTGASSVRERAEQAIRFALWWCRDGIVFGGTSATQSGVRILVICAVCRRVRSASGDWALFPEPWWPRPHVLSHGYCPECAERELWTLATGDRPPSLLESARVVGRATAANGREARHE